MAIRRALWLVPALMLVMSPIDAAAKNGKYKGARGTQGTIGTLGTPGTFGAAREAKGGGPPFCRNGAGHPVHGWEWCRAKGWADRGWFDTTDRRQPRVAIPRGRVPEEYRFPDDYYYPDNRWRLRDWLPF